MLSLLALVTASIVSPPVRLVAGRRLARGGDVRSTCDAAASTSATLFGTVNYNPSSAVIAARTVREEAACGGLLAVADIFASRWNATDDSAPTPRLALRPPAVLPAAAKRLWRARLGCEFCADTRAVPCPNCDGTGGYEAMGGVAVACRACRSTGRVVCRDCFTGDGYDIEAIRRDMGFPD